MDAAKLWELDDKPPCGDMRRHLAKIPSTPHPRLKEGQRITFWTGYSDDIRAAAIIKRINGADVYVYNDCYWFPIQDDQRRKIKIEE